MKKIIAMLVLFLCFGTAVSASGINGEFNGNPIVKIKSKGKVLAIEDTPAVIYEGRTMVPIYMLKQLGADVTWDQNTYSVDVVLAPTNNTNDIKTLKLYSKIADHYKFLESLGDLLFNLGNNFTLTINSISAGDKRSFDDLTVSNDRINKAVNSYNDAIKISESLFSEAGKSNIVLNETRSILNDYYSALEYYKKAAENLNSYYSTNKYTSDIYDNLSLGDKIVSNSMSVAVKQYHYFYDRIQGYNP